MTRAKKSAFAPIVLAGLALSTGCGSSSDCSVTPDVSRAPDSCSLAPDEPVTVNVNWCDCGAPTTCNVRLEGGGIIQLEPQVTSCDASCPINSGSCPFDKVPCTFTIPGAGTFSSFYVISGLSFVPVPLEVVSGGDTVCSPSPG